jgi:hypothetical protein
MKGSSSRNVTSAFLLAAFAALLNACATAQSPLAGMSREERQEAGRQVTVRPSPFSTLEFKELGDSRRHEAMRRLINQTWQADCQPSSVVAATYLPNGSSTWRVRCAGGTLSYDYLVSIPETRPIGARVLKCYQERPRTVTCTIVGDPRIAAQEAR